MFKLIIIFALTSLLSARPQAESEPGYDLYGEYYDHYDYDYEEGYDTQVRLKYRVVMSPVSILMLCLSRTK